MNDALLQELIDAGTPPLLVAKVAAELARVQERVEAALVADRRSPAAVKQQRYRDRLKADAVTRGNDVTKEVTRYGEGNTTPTPDKKSPQTPKKINPTPCGCEPPAHVRAELLRIAMTTLIAALTPIARKPAKASRIPLGWSPEKPLPEAVAALVALWPPGRAERELDGFRDYWTVRQRDAARSDWDRVWWNRIRDQHDRIIRENRNGQQSDRSRAFARQRGGWSPRPGMEGAEPAFLTD